MFPIFLSISYYSLVVKDKSSPFCVEYPQEWYHVFSGFIRPARLSLAPVGLKGIVDSLQKQPARVTLTYLDQGKAEYRLAAGAQSMNVACKGTGDWRTASLDVPAGRLKPDGEGAHIRLLSVESPVHG